LRLLQSEILRGFNRLVVWLRHRRLFCRLYLFRHLGNVGCSCGDLVRYNLHVHPVEGLEVVEVLEDFFFHIDPYLVEGFYVLRGEARVVFKDKMLQEIPLPNNRDDVPPLVFVLHSDLIGPHVEVADVEIGFGEDIGEVLNLVGVQIQVLELRGLG